jgi:preprotein translocase subunit YajC
MADVVWAMARPEGGAPESPFWVQLVPFFAIFVIFYFLLIRPQAKRQREVAKMLAGLKKGDRVLTQGGIFGVVVGVKDDMVVLKIADNVKIEVARSAVTGVQGHENG